MADIGDMAMIAAVGVGIYALTRLMGAAEGAGRWVAQQVEYQTTNWQSYIEGTGFAAVPPTPAGYLPSNWMYEAGTYYDPYEKKEFPISWGVQPGKTPVELCRETGWSSAECKAIRPLWDKILGGAWYEIW